jgi:hypothetical protein
MPQLSAYDPMAPWNSVLKAAGTDHEFWDRELKEPALLYSLGHGRVEPSHVERQPEVPTGMGKKALKRKRQQEAAARAPTTRPPPPAGKGQGKGKESHPRKTRQGTYLTSRDGSQVCFTWNRDRDGCKTGPCPNRRAHVCEHCLQPHRGVDCNGAGAARSAPHM